MRHAIQRLPKAEEEALIAVACENGLRRSELKCTMTRQHGEGRGRFSERRRGLGYLDNAPFNISYDLLLCQHCGNLEPSDVCPAKVQVIKDRLLNA